MKDMYVYTRQSYVTMLMNPEHLFITPYLSKPQEIQKALLPEEVGHDFRGNKIINNVHHMPRTYFAADSAV